MHSDFMASILLSLGTISVLTCSLAVPCSCFLYAQLLFFALMLSMSPSQYFVDHHHIFAKLTYADQITAFRHDDQRV
ncbi:hypothetical protein CPB83DRAFT_564058 [Crepidotus variabilis]|uniref:Uncharacterized protein n=1 Tax=Crepidotus variabilis TaxID=179855 RepID=A0A9P6JLG1_9AGAR|nr:hypothetical protein CPB83DRAFT_564058 [Crepidotus variabilis]